MNISEQEKADLKRLAQEYNVDFDELVTAYEKASKEMYGGEEKIDDVFKELETKKGNDSNLDKAIDELTQRINKLRENERIGEKVNDEVEILEQVEKCKQEGLIPSESNEGGIENA